MSDDPTIVTLRLAVVQRREIDFNLGGAPVTMRPHILYVDPDGVLKIAGTVGDIPVARVPVGQVKDLLISARYFNPDAAFDFSHPDYDNPIATVTGI